MKVPAQQEWSPEAQNREEQADQEGTSSLAGQSPWLGEER